MRYTSPTIYFRGLNHETLQPRQPASAPRSEPQPLDYETRHEIRITMCFEMRRKLSSRISKYVITKHSISRDNKVNELNTKPHSRCDVPFLRN
jgi:hypothetical protein